MENRWTAEHTHSFETHQHKLFSFSFPANLSLEIVGAVLVLLIGLMNHWNTDENHNY